MPRKQRAHMSIVSNAQVAGLFAEPSALAVNKNAYQITLRPGSKAGAMARIDAGGSMIKRFAS